MTQLEVALGCVASDAWLRKPGSEVVDDFTTSLRRAERAAPSWLKLVRNGIAVVAVEASSRSSNRAIGAQRRWARRRRPLPRVIRVTPMPERGHHEPYEW